MGHWDDAGSRIRINAMDIAKILNDLRAERAQVEEAILMLERLQRGQSARRRGRPPKWLAALNAESTEQSHGTREKDRHHGSA